MSSESYQGCLSVCKGPSCEQLTQSVSSWSWNPVDAGTEKRKAARLGRNGKRNGPGGKRDTSSGRSFDLPAIDSEYDLDPKWTSWDTYGNGLKRYIHRGTGMSRAVLTVRKSAIPAEISDAEVRKQLETLCKIDHVNVVQFREAFEDESHLKLVYDWCPGGPLVSQLWRYEEFLNEGHIAQIMRELLSALAAAHAFGIHHCDLGLFSIFLSFEDRLSPIKVFGFGLAGFLMPVLINRKESRTNKHFYASPEMFLGGGRFKLLSAAQRHASDVWSVGTILFTICSGRPPFGTGAKAQVMSHVTDDHWAFGLEFSQFSSTLREFIEANLTWNWQKRKPASEMLGLPWLSNAQTLHIKDGMISSMAMQQLNTFVAQDHVKQTMARLLTDIGISDDLYPKLEAQFRELDLNGDGTITLGELMQVAEEIPGMTKEDVDQMIAKLDRNGNCTVDISEFIAALVMEQDEADEQLLQKAFCRMDLNGDARVTKKELFGVLRQYSTSVEVEEVSEFVARTDKDGDAKMDYREFCMLFPAVADKYKDINARISCSRLSIESGPKSLKDFQEVIGHWLKKIMHKRDKIEIGCDVQPLPATSQSLHYSYEKGHFSEWEVQIMIHDCVELLHEVPGYQQTEYMKKMRKFKENEKVARTSTSDSKVIGASTLTRNREILKAKREKAKDAEDSVSSAGSGEENAVATKNSAQKNVEAGNNAENRKVSKDGADVTKGVKKDGTDLNKDEQANDGTEAKKDGKVLVGADVNTDGADVKKQRHNHHRKGKVKDQRGVIEWDGKATQDRKERMMDPGYKACNQVYENLYWLVRIKSDMYWQQPLRDIIHDMQESCIEELQEVTVSSATDLLRIIGQLTEKYEMKEPVDIGDGDNRVKIKKESRLLPLGVLKGKNLQDTEMLSKLEETHLPAVFVLGHSKGDYTHQKIWFMKHRHSQGMMATGRHLTWVINSLDALFREVTEDLKMTASLEAVMECPPNMSRLFLPFAGDVAEDAGTPRDSFEEEPEPQGLDRSMSKSFRGSMTMGSMSSLPEGTSFAASEEAIAPAKKGKKLERNQVLTMAANYARTAKQEQVKAAAAASAGAPTISKRGSLPSTSSSMFSSSRFSITASMSASKTF